MARFNQSLIEARSLAQSYVQAMSPAKIGTIAVDWLELSGERGRGAEIMINSANDCGQIVTLFEYRRPPSGQALSFADMLV
jgi:hypothetical protein